MDDLGCALDWTVLDFGCVLGWVLAVLGCVDDTLPVLPVTVFEVGGGPLSASLIAMSRSQCSGTVKTLEPCIEPIKALVMNAELAEPKALLFCLAFVFDAWVLCTFPYTLEFASVLEDELLDCKWVVVKLGCAPEACEEEPGWADCVLALPSALEEPVTLNPSDLAVL